MLKYVSIYIYISSYYYYYYYTHTHTRHSSECLGKRCDAEAAAASELLEAATATADHWK